MQNQLGWALNDPEGIFVQHIMFLMVLRMSRLLEHTGHFELYSQSLDQVSRFLCIQAWGNLSWSRWHHKDPIQTEMFCLFGAKDSIYVLHSDIVMVSLGFGCVLGQTQTQTVWREDGWLRLTQPTVFSPLPACLLTADPIPLVGLAVW